MSTERLQQQLRFIIEADKLKEIFRQSLCTQSRRNENDAEHSWHLCLLVIVLAEHSHTPIDVLRVLKMVIIHDLVEIDAGDTFAYDTARMADQHARESLAADRIFGLLPRDQRDELRALWDEFEMRETSDAKFAAAVDRFHPVLLNCLTEGAAWRRNGVSADKVLARTAHVSEGSGALWEQLQAMVNQAERDGLFRAE